MTDLQLVVLAPEPGTGLDDPMALTMQRLPSVAATSPSIGVHVIAPRSSEADYRALPTSSITLSLIDDGQVAAAVNGAVRGREGRVLFALPGTDPAALVARWRSVDHDGRRLTAGIRSAAVWGHGRSSRFLEQGHPGGSAAPLGWLMSADIVSIDNALVDLSLIDDVGGFDEGSSLGDGWWWQFTARAAAMGELRWQAVPPSGHSYPLGMVTGASRRRTPDVRRQVSSTLTSALQKRRGRARPVAPTGILGRSGPTRITVLAGVNEPAHTQLAFLNYLQHPLLSSDVTWSVVLEDVATREDVADSDVLILNRVRSENGDRLLTYARAQGIPTLYFIDDNWFSAAKDMPALAPIFGEGTPTMRRFHRALKQCDRVLTLNETLAADCAAAGAEVRLHRPAIDITAHLDPAARSSARTAIGFLGSVRVSRRAFEAARRVLDRDASIDVVVFGNDPATEFAGLPANRLRRHDWVFDYDDYTRVARGLGVDILIAPLGNSRLELSKCPNKYLESAVIGAAGVYSASPVYTAVVRDGENGVLVDRDDVSAWETAIDQLLDPGARERIAKGAREHVLAHHSIEATMPEFVSLMRELLDLAR